MSTARPRILRLADLPAQPWANGQGTTTEILREGDQGDWAWRVSVASIDRPGPFSTFPGVDRTLVCAGPGSITLRIGQDTRRLDPGERADFPGEADVETREVTAPSRDLNVMTRRGRASAAVGTLQVGGGATTVHCPDGTTMLLVLLDGACAVGDEVLAPLDTVVLGPGESVDVGSGRRDTACEGRGDGAASDHARLVMISLRLASAPVHEATSDTDTPEPWSPQSRAAYIAAMDALVADLQRQTRLVAALDEQHFLHDPDTRGMWFASVDLVQRALNAAHEAEMDWTGTSSLPAVDLGEEDDEPELLGVWQEPPGDVISLAGRWDVRIRDMDAFIQAGREAYSRQYDLSDPAFAEANVTTAIEAAAALVESPDWPELHIAGVSDPAAAFWQFVHHDGSDVGWLEDGDDPFDILDADDD